MLRIIVLYFYPLVIVYMIRALVHDTCTGVDGKGLGHWARREGKGSKGVHVLVYAGSRE